MSYDQYKQETPPSGLRFGFNQICDCGKSKGGCDNFCAECKEKRKVWFRKRTPQELANEMIDRGHRKRILKTENEINKLKEKVATKITT